MDETLIDDLVNRAKQNLELQKKKKITELFKKGLSDSEISAQIDSRFLSADSVSEQLSRIQAVKNENKGHNLHI